MISFCALCVLGCPLHAFPYHLFAGESKKYAGDRIQLGSTGIEVSRLAVGTGTRGVRGNSNQTPL
ncbi:hypothetical protein MYX75_11650 [Acidobacteria bacterium AH-259-A15]|nr:hypothetical protein [Acidobacteria bacterium AH-259-A15]